MIEKSPKEKLVKKQCMYEDKYTITEQEVEAYEIWVVANNLGFMSSFNNKEDAIKFVEGIVEKL